MSGMREEEGMEAGFMREESADGSNSLGSISGGSLSLSLSESSSTRALRDMVVVVWSNDMAVGRLGVY